MNQSKKPLTLGLDIGHSTIKWVIMKGSAGQFSLEQKGSMPIEIKDGQSDQEAVRGTLEQVLKAIGISSEHPLKIVSVLPGPQVYCRRMTLPIMPKGELMDAIRWEIKNSLPFAVDEAELAFEILGEVEDKGIKKFSVLAAVAPREEIENHLTLLQTLGLEIEGFLPLSYAVQNVLAKVSTVSQKTVALIEMGDVKSELNIYREGHLEFSRQLPIAGREITKSLTGAIISDTGRIELSLQEAEQVKHEVGFSQEETQPQQGKMKTAQVLALIRSELEQLASEIERSLTFYREMPGGGEVDQILLCGGGSQLKGLPQFLSEELGLEVQVANFSEALSRSFPPANGSDGKTGIEHSFYPALGAVVGSRRGLNLLPMKYREEKKQTIQRISLEAVVSSISVVLLLVLIGMKTQAKTLEGKLNVIHFEQKLLLPEMQGLIQEALLQQAVGRHPFWEDVFKKISRAVPDSIYLTQMNMDKEGVTLEGVIVGRAESQQKTLSGLMLTLEEGLFEDVKLVTTQKNDQNFNESKFEVYCSFYSQPVQWGDEG